jgi:hypothetical protein
MDPTEPEEQHRSPDERASGAAVHGGTRPDGDEDIEPFAEEVASGMQRIPAGAAPELELADAKQLLEQLDEFDAVRLRGDVESRTAELGRDRS